VLALKEPSLHIANAVADDLGRELYERRPVSFGAANLKPLLGYAELICDSSARGELIRVAAVKGWDDLICMAV
jgi:hypothetical protein